jgi:hypothetical protein
MERRASLSPTRRTHGSDLLVPLLQLGTSANQVEIKERSLNRIVELFLLFQLPVVVVLVLFVFSFFLFLFSLLSFSLVRSSRKMVNTL